MNRGAVQYFMTVLGNFVGRSGRSGGPGAGCGLAASVFRTLPKMQCYRVSRKQLRLSFYCNLPESSQCVRRVAHVTTR